MNSPSAGRRSTCPGRRRAIPGTPTHFTAGSSSGTGAAVAAGMILGGTGSDTGGSIRGPAALCGIAGIKPTYGLVSRAGVLPLSFTLDHAGPAGLDGRGLRAAAAGDGRPRSGRSGQRRPPGRRTSPPSSTQGVKGLRIGVVRHFYETDHPVSPATLAGIDDAPGRVRARSAPTVRDVTLSPLADYQACGWMILIVEAFAVHEPWLKERFNDYGESVPRPGRAGRRHARRRLRAGDAPAPHRCAEQMAGDGRLRHPGDRPGRPARRRGSPSAEMGTPGEAVTSPSRST